MNGHLPEMGRWRSSTGLDDATVVYSATAHQSQPLQDCGEQVAAILLLMSLEKSPHTPEDLTRE